MTEYLALIAEDFEPTTTHTRKTKGGLLYGPVEVIEDKRSDADKRNSVWTFGEGLGQASREDFMKFYALVKYGVKLTEKEIALITEFLGHQTAWRVLMMEEHIQGKDEASASVKYLIELSKGLTEDRKERLESLAKGVAHDEEDLEELNSL